MNPSQLPPNNQPSIDDMMKASGILNSDINVSSEKSEEFYKAIQKLYDGKNLHFITELSAQEVLALSKIKALYEWTDKKVKIMEVFIVWYMKFKVSQLRKGRGEFFDTFKARLPIEDEKERSRFGSFFTPRR